MKKLFAMMCLFFVSTGLGDECDFMYLDTPKRKPDTYNECNRQCAALEDEMQSLDTRIAKRNLKIRKIENAILNYNGPYPFLGSALICALINPVISLLFLGGAVINIGNAHLVRPARHSWHRNMLFNLEKKRADAQGKFEQNCMHK